MGGGVGVLRVAVVGCNGDEIVPAFISTAPDMRLLLRIDALTTLDSIATLFGLVVVHEAFLTSSTGVPLAGFGEAVFAFDLTASLVDCACVRGLVLVSDLTSGVDTLISFVFVVVGVDVFDDVTADVVLTGVTLAEFFGDMLSLCSPWKIDTINSS